MTRHFALLTCLAASPAALPALAQPPCDAAAAQRRTEEAYAAAPGAPRAAAARAAVAACPGDAAAHNVLGHALEESGDFAGAAAEYRRAVEASPDWVLPLLGLGDLARKQGDLLAAREHYERARQVARDPAARAEAEQALAQLPASGGFGFKSAGEISRGIRVGLKTSASDTAGLAPSNAGDFYQSGSGIAVNFSIGFEVASADLRPDGRRQLDELGRALQGFTPGERYRIEGHASSDGHPEFNRRLSLARARAARDYLLARFGLPPDLLEAVGRGTEEPVLVAGMEDRVKSRRVTVLRRFDGS